MDDAERLFGECRVNEFARLSMGERREELELRELPSGSIVDGTGEPEADVLLPFADPEFETAMRPSGTW